MALHPSQISRNDAETEKHLAERDLFAAQARVSVAAAERAELDLKQEQRLEGQIAANNEFHKVYVFDDGVDDETVSECMDLLVIWSRNEPECEIEIQINSPGGDIIAGFALIDFIRGLREKGHKVTMVGLGVAASMAAVLLQAGDERLMGRYCTMLIHEGSMLAFGDFGQVQDRVKLMEILHKKILALFVERAKVDEKFIRRHWERKDWWLTAEECLEYGFVDGIR